MCCEQPGGKLPWRPGGDQPIKGAAGNEKGDEWARLAAEETDAHGAERLRCVGPYGGRHMPFAETLCWHQAGDLGGEVDGGGRSGGV